MLPQPIAFASVGREFGGMVEVRMSLIGVAEPRGIHRRRQVQQTGCFGYIRRFRARIGKPIRLVEGVGEDARGPAVCANPLQCLGLTLARPSDQRGFLRLDSRVVAAPCSGQCQLGMPQILGHTERDDASLDQQFQSRALGIASSMDRGGMQLGQ